MSDDTATPPTVPVRGGYGTGCYRRSIVLEASSGEVRAELADDFHHFGVRLVHDGQHAVSVEGEDVRVPWTTCPGAVAPLREMEGVGLSTVLSGLLRHTNARAQCTHLHDLACLAIAHAARVSANGGGSRRYDISVPDRLEGRATVELQRDGQVLLSWAVDGSSVTDSDPSTFAGLKLSGSAFHRFCAELDDDLAEAAFVLQRAVFIGLGRRHDFEEIREASTFAPVVGAACYTFDPTRVGNAKRVYGSLRDFTSAPHRILERK
jgi:hypothetical protein